MLSKKALIIEGSVFITLGIIAVIWPHLSSFAIERIAGWLFVLGGLFQIVKSIRNKAAWFSYIISVAYLVAGTLLLLYPQKGIATLTWVMAFLFFLQGLFQLAMAISLQGRIRVGLFCSGTLAILLSVLLWMNWPEDASWALGFILGINLVFFGFTEIISAKTLSKR